MEKIISNNSVDIFNKVKEILNYIENEFLTQKSMINGVETNKYQINRNLSELGNMELLNAIMELGICDRKRIKRYLNKIIKKTLRSINTLLRFVSKKLCILTDEKAIKITEPQHEIIQKLRQEWIIKDSHAREALAQYKKMKGEYYKKLEIVTA